MCQTYIDLAEYYKLNFTLMQDHHWSLSEIEAMMPFERDIYVWMLHAHLIKRAEAQTQQQQ